MFYKLASILFKNELTKLVLRIIVRNNICFAFSECFSWIDKEMRDCEGAFLFLIEREKLEVLSPAASEYCETMKDKIRCMFLKPMPEHSSEAQLNKYIITARAMKLKHLFDFCDIGDHENAKQYSAQVHAEKPENSIIVDLQECHEKKERSVIHFNPPCLKVLQEACKALNIVPQAALNSPLLKPFSNYLGGNFFLRFKITRVTGDGNCGPRAISLSLTGNEDHHWKIRVVLTKELAMNPILKSKPCVNRDTFTTIILPELLLNNDERYEKLHKLLENMESGPVSADFFMSSDYLIALGALTKINYILVSEDRGLIPHSAEGYNQLVKNRPNICLHFTGIHVDAIISPM